MLVPHSEYLRTCVKALSDGNWVSVVAPADSAGEKLVQDLRLEGNLFHPVSLSPSSSSRRHTVLPSDTGCTPVSSSLSSSKFIRRGGKQMAFMQLTKLH